MQVSAAPPHLNPGRAPAVAYALVVPVAIGAALASLAVRTAIEHSAEWFEDGSPTAWRWPVPLVIAVAMIALLAARALGGAARQADPSGNDVSWALTGADRSPWRRASAHRIVATLTASIGLAPIGREVAVLEIGALVGDTTVRGRQGSRRLAAAGVAAAFTAAYHAPLAATVFVVEHLVWSRYSGPERHRAAARLTPWAGAGAAIGHVTALTVLGDKPLLPAPGAITPTTLLLAAALATPAAWTVGRLTRLRTGLSAWAHRGSALRPTVLLLLGAVAVGVFPLVSGNGLAALRTTAGGVTLAMAAVLVVGRLLATSSVLAAGVPGGVFTPSIALASGTAALFVAALEQAGVGLSVDAWDAVVVVGAVGVAVSLRSPLVAALVVPEMTGQISLVPACAAVVAVAWLIARPGAETVRPGGGCSGRYGRRAR